MIDKIDKLAEEILGKKIDGSFGARFKRLMVYFSNVDLLPEFFTKEELKMISKAQKASDLNNELLLKLKSFMDNYNSILEYYPDSYDALFIVEVVNSIHEALNMKPIVLRKVKEIEYDPEKSRYVLNYGSLFPDDVECDCIGYHILKQMVENGQIEGTYIAEVMAAEYGIKNIKFDHDIDNIEFNVLPVNTKELEKLKEQYLKYMAPKKGMEKYDNKVVIVVDFPEYSGSNNNYITETILVSSKEKSYFINLGISKEYYYKDYSELIDDYKKILTKKLTSNS